MEYGRDFLRVVVLCGDPGVPIHGPSGSSAHLRGVVRGLVSRGHDVGVVALRDHDHRGRYDVPLGAHAVTCPPRTWPSGLRTWGEREDARRLVRRASRVFSLPDLIYERASLRCDAGLRWAKRLGIPHVLELNAPLPIERGASGSLVEVVRQTNRVVAVSAWVANWASRAGAGSVLHVPNGSALQPRKKKAPGPLRCVHHGSVRADQGRRFFKPLIEALPEARLLLLGGQPLEHPQIDWRETVDPGELQRHLEACHVGLVPFLPGAPPWFDPLKLADYRAVGLPTIGSLHPVASGCSKVVSVAEPKLWARAVRDLASNDPVPMPRPWAQVCAEALAGWER